MGHNQIFDLKDPMSSKDYKSYVLRAQKVEELVEKLNNLQEEAGSLRTNKVTSGVASKLTKIKVVRKNIARSMTIINEKKRDELKKLWKSRAALKAYNEENKTAYRYSDKPLACREKKTHARRRALTKRQQNAQTLRQRKQAVNFPRRNYALR